MTDTVAFNVKWNKDSFKVDFVIAGGVKGLKNELEEKTGVPADRMKLMAKSKGKRHEMHGFTKGKSVTYVINSVVSLFHS